tara:strand:+ start:451 stop:858 length:408 start_codon:yes stop_codon:yes gene_type:complete
MQDNISSALIDTSISVNSNDNECFICYEDMNDADKVMTLPCCKKELHTKCLEKWHSEMEGECSCPHCMTVLYTKISQEDNEQIRLIDINTANSSLTITVENDDVSYCEKYILSCLSLIFCYICIGGSLTILVMQK